MLSIFATTDHIHTVQRIIDTENRLSELVGIYDSLEKAPGSDGLSLIIDSRGISHPVDWHNDKPPYLYPEFLPLTPSILLGLLFDKLGNGEKAMFYLKEEPLLQRELGMMNKLQYGYEIGQQEIDTWIHTIDPASPFDQYRMHHNLAILSQYGYLDGQPNFDEIESHYIKALQLAPHAELNAYTTRHFATFLIDAKVPGKALPLLEASIKNALSADAVYSLKAVLTNVWMEQLVVPYDPILLEKLKTTLWQTLQFFERKERKAEAGLLLLDAAQIANISNSFSEALGYLSKAHQIFEQEGLEELAGNAQLRKGTLLYTWAQNGNPQFFKPAIESYQQALKVFRQDVAPDVFADIHHQLAVLYAEIPADQKKKGIWAGVSSASFQAALNFFTKEKYPYQYGMICNNYGNALTKFPLAIHSDNYEKALYYYQEALNVRTPAYAYERAISLLNYLEASWKVSNESEELNKERFEDMTRKALEVKTLVSEPGMLEEADRHLEMLSKLEQVSTK